jgi:hypothetical protein
MNTTPKTNLNPLSMYMRQPKIYIRLPSNGEFWSTGSLEVTESGEYPVFSMTAKDELMLKIPDALINGQAIVDVIQHCMPNIKNAWAMPSIDLDVILIAIRVATYGEKMTIPVTKNKVEAEYEVDLRYILGELQEKITWDTYVQINPELIVHVRPVDYRQISSSSVKTFETQRIIEVASSSSMSDKDKAAAFKDALETLNNVTVGIVNNSVFKIESAQGTIDNLQHIREFMENVDKEVFDMIKKHVESLRDHNNIKPLRVQPTQEMIDAGVSDEAIEVPLIFDPTTFFA